MNMHARLRLCAIPLFSICAHNAIAKVDSDFKEYPTDRFTIQTGDGYYKQVYHWAYNTQGTGEPVTIFLNHGSGGEWYKEITTDLGPCGGDYLSATDDFEGSAYEGKCVTDANGNLTSLADFETNFVPVGPLTEEFMLRKIVGSTAFAAWYWQDAITEASPTSPVNIYMVGRYNVAEEAEDLDNILWWVNLTDPATVTRETLPPYNFDGFGVKDIDGDDRPFHAAPDISGYDNMFLYKHLVQNENQVIDHLIIEGRSNGGSAMIALAADYAIWPVHIRDFWEGEISTQQDPWAFDPDAFRSKLAVFLGADIYDSVEMVHFLYGGCRLDGLMEQNASLPEGAVADDGDTRDGYRTVMKLLFSFAAQDSIYTSWCDDRLSQGQANSPLMPRFLTHPDTSYGVNGLHTVEGEVFDPADHGFDYDDVYKNLPAYSQADQDKAAQARRAIEKAVNISLHEMGMVSSYQLPENID